MSHTHREFIDSRETLTSDVATVEDWAEYEMYLDGELFEAANDELAEFEGDDDEGDYDDGDWYENDGQPDEAQEWFDFDPDC